MSKEEIIEELKKDKVSLDNPLDFSEEYENISSNCKCQICQRKIKIGESVFSLNEELVNICKECKEAKK